MYLVFYNSSVNNYYSKYFFLNTGNGLGHEHLWRFSPLVWTIDDQTYRAIFIPSKNDLMTIKTTDFQR